MHSEIPAMNEKAQVQQLPLDLAGTVVRSTAPIISRCVSKTSLNSPSSRRSSPRYTSSGFSSRSSPSAPRTQSWKAPRSVAYCRRVPQFMPGRRLGPWLVVVAFWFVVVLRVQTNRFIMERNHNTHPLIRSNSLGLDRTPSFYENGSPRPSQLQKELSSFVTGDGNIKEPRMSGMMQSSTGDGDMGSVQTTLGQIPLQSRGRMGTKGAHKLRPGLGGFEVEWPHIEKQSEMIREVKSIGKLVGPFDELETVVMGWERFTGSCETHLLLATFVTHKVVVVVFHELSMTGAPLSMLELATMMQVCGARVSAVILNKAGGLYSVLGERGIRILQDKSVRSWSAAEKADLVIVGSAACASWVSQYLSFYKDGANRLVWWVMENRREYFDRAKNVLGDVRALMFLSQTQAQLWTEWYSQNGSVLTPDVHIVPLSINDELASVAGLNKDFDNEITRKRGELRRRVREAMGLEPNDLLLLTLSSINSGKGQLLLVQAASMFTKDSDSVEIDHVNPELVLEEKSRRPFLAWRTKENFIHKEQAVDFGVSHKKSPRVRLLIGSIGSKSNKPAYVEKILRVLDQNPQLADLTMSVAATSHVAPLYAAADAYVMNSQGIGETFGRVTIEAMAFGLPVLATNAGGSLEIVEENFTGLLHPIGIAGTPVLAQHILWLSEHKEEREQMGQNGQEKVMHLFREELMYEKLAKVFMQIVDSHV